MKSRTRSAADLEAANSFPFPLAAFLMLLFTGCGYTFEGSAVPGVRTVHVPVFQNQSFRRNIDYLLTEAVQREIRTRGDYRLADADVADTILSGRILDLQKTPLSETRFDDSRELQVLLAAEVTWTDRRSGRVLHQQVFPIGPELTQHASQVSFAPEVGHSMATAQQEAARRLAAGIADLMELPW